MRKLIVSILGFAFCCGCFAGLQSEVKTEQNEWLSGQTAILVDQLADSDNVGFWLAGQNEILLSLLKAQIEGIAHCD